jgi:uncharacterized BrkB/YihY/UPF0761 family membrane protein
MSQRWRLIVGVLGASLGAVLLVAGLAVLLGQVAHYVHSLQWPGYSLLELIKSASASKTLPGVLQLWLSRPESSGGALGSVIGLLDTVPAYVFLIGFGGLILRKALR